MASELIQKRIYKGQLILLAVVMQHSIRTLISRADSDIYAPSDLIGRTIMLNANEQAEFLAMFKSEGISSGRITIIPKDKKAVEKLINKEIVAMNGSLANQPYRYVRIQIAMDITKRKYAEEQIKAYLKEKETLFQEIHHRVKNNMTVIASLLKLQIHKNDDERIKEALIGSQNRVYAIAAVHEILFYSDSFSDILIEPFIGKIVKYVFQTYQMNPDQVTLYTEFDALKLNIEKASPLGLVVNELVSNALKYAFPDGKAGEIALCIKKTGRR